MTTLAPCPFCGVPPCPALSYWKKQWAVRCIKCGIYGPDWLTKAEAITAWNTRAESRLLKAAEALLGCVLPDIYTGIGYDEYMSASRELSAAVKEAKGE